MTSLFFIVEANITKDWSNRPKNTVSNYIFLIDANKTPMNPIHPAATIPVLSLWQ
jgi:hypothetical protein